MVKILLAILVILSFSCNINTSVVEICHYNLPTEALKRVTQSERTLPVVGQEYSTTYKCRTQTGIPAESAFIARSMHAELTERGALSDGIIDPKALRTYLHKKVTEQPLIRVYLYSMATGVVKKDNRVHGVVFSGRDGRQVLLAKAVVDATEDARLATSAGAELLLTMSGDKTASRFISASLPASIPLGTYTAEDNSRLRDSRIIIHDGYVELEIPARIGEDVSGDLSRIHGETLEMSFALRDHFEKLGWLTLVTLDNYRNNFIPCPETYIDEMPVVACIEQMNPKDISEIGFQNASAITPKGIDGMLIAGRTVYPGNQAGSLHALMSIGGFAGKSASGIADQTDRFMKLTQFELEKQPDKGGLQIRELLQGIEPVKEYPSIVQSETELPVLGEYDVVVVVG